MYEFNDFRYLLNPELTLCSVVKENYKERNR